MSLRLRLVLLNGLLTGATVLLFALVFYLFLQFTLTRTVDQQLRERAALVQQALVEESQSDLPTLPLLVELAAPGIYVELVDATGAVRAVSPNLAGDRLPIDAAVIAEVQRGTSGMATVQTADGQVLRTLGVPVAAGGVLLVAESLLPLQQTLLQARGLLLLCGAVAVTIAVATTAFAVGRELAPINWLTRTTAQVAATGDYHKRVPTTRRDEIGQLTTTINTLIATVEQSLTQQRQFLADTSHELRSPLTVVLANLDLLRRDLPKADRDEAVGEAMTEARRMRRLVNDLLLLAQADTAQVIAHAPVQLDKLVADTVAIVGRQATTHSLATTIAEPMTVLGDEERLVQVLRNLLENAVRHTPAGTEVTVRLRRSNELAQLIVADTGPGIAAEHLPHIWNRFYQTDKARTRNAGGSGLGLAIVKYLVEAHGGTVRVTSRAGEGTTFTVLLPLKG